MSDAYEAGTPPDAEMQAFLAKEESPAPSKEYAPEDDARLKAEEVPAEKQEADAPESPEQAAQQQAPAPEAEEDARAMGWAPKDQWRGDPDKWVDAETFLKRADDNPRILRERLKSERKRNQEMVSNMERMNEQALARQKASLDQERDALIHQYAGNPNAIRQINHNHEQAVQEIQQPAYEPAAQSWINQHPRFSRDTAFNQTAQGILMGIHQEMQGKPLAEHFEELDRRLAKIFPDEFGGAASSAPPAASRQMDGVRTNGGKRSSNYANRLPAAAKTQGERFVKNGDFKNIEEYAKEYFDA